MSNGYRVWLEGRKSCCSRYPHFVASGDHYAPRRCGYVIWDDLGSGMDDEMFQKHLLNARNLDAVPATELEESRAEMERSWEERTAIYKRGGRGYWSKGDLSQIVWGEEASSS